MQGVQRTIETGVEPSTIAIGDWNGDGIADFAVANGRGSSVSVLLGCGAGTFAPRTDYPLGPTPRALISCDLNGDQKPDLVLANFNYANSSSDSAGTVTVLLGHGDGTFSTVASYPPSQSFGSRGLACADLSGDGVPDLAAANSSASAVSVLRGRGDGTLLTRVDYPTASNPHVVVAADLNGDGKVDLVTGNGSYQNVSTLLGKGDGTFAEHVDQAHGSEGSSGLAVGDLNGDGRLDLGIGDTSGRGPPAHFGMMPGNGDGTFGRLVDYPPVVDTCQVASGDLNGDSRLDLVGVTYLDIRVLLGQPGGQLQRGSDFKFERNRAPCSLALGDMNGDGKLDILIPSGEQQVSLLLGAGDGTFP